MKLQFVIFTIALLISFSGCRKMMPTSKSSTTVLLKNENVSDTKYTVQYSTGGRCGSNATNLMSEQCLNPGESKTCTFNNGKCQSTYFKVIATGKDFTQVFEKQIPAYNKPADKKTITFSCKKTGEIISLDFEIPEESKGTALQ